MVNRGEEKVRVHMNVVPRSTTPYLPKPYRGPWLATGIPWNKKETMYGRSDVNVKVEEGSTFTFTRGLSPSFLLFTHVRT